MGNSRRKLVEKGHNPYYYTDGYWYCGACGICPLTEEEEVPPCTGTPRLPFFLNLVGMFLDLFGIKVAFAIENANTNKKEV